MPPALKWRNSAFIQTGPNEPFGHFPAGGYIWGPQSQLVTFEPCGFTGHFSPEWPSTAGKLCLKQWHPPGPTVSLGSHLAVPGESPGCHDCGGGRGALPASSGYGQGCR